MTVIAIPTAKFRFAGPDDEDLLFRWRREQERTGRREGWYHGRATSRSVHHRWFRDRTVVEILIWERAGRPLGYVRIDSNGELSFFPHSMEAVPMLAATWAFADRYGGRLKATVDEANIAASEALEAAGFAACPVSFHVYRA